jgi:hypothetical protein
LFLFVIYYILSLFSERRTTVERDNDDNHEDKYATKKHPQSVFEPGTPEAKNGSPPFG